MLCKIFITSTIKTIFFKTNGTCIYFKVWTHTINKRVEEYTDLNPFEKVE